METKKILIELIIFQVPISSNKTRNSWQQKTNNQLVNTIKNNRYKIIKTRTYSQIT